MTKARKSKAAKPKSVVAAAAKSPPAELLTVLDFIRYAVTRFGQAELAFGQGTYDAAEEATFLVAEALGLPIDAVDPYLPARLTAAERRHLLALIEARIRRRMPAAYLLDCAYLQGVRFVIDRRVIVPRSYLAELLFGDLFAGDAPLFDPSAVTRVLELCTGCGCLAVLAAKAFPNAHIDATDISADALEVAAINVKRHGLEDRIALHEGDLFAPVGDAVYDVILANPPYVARKAAAALPPEFAHEPRLALDGGADGMDIVRRILAGSGAHLRGGGLLCEVGRGRRIVERDYPQTEFLWLDTAESSGEVFWIAAPALPR